MFLGKVSLDINFKLIVNFQTFLQNALQALKVYYYRTNLIWIIHEMIINTGLKMTQKQAARAVKDFFQVLVLPFLGQREIFLETEKWKIKHSYCSFWRPSNLVFPTTLPGNRLESEGWSHEYDYNSK